MIWFWSWKKKTESGFEIMNWSDGKYFEEYFLYQNDITLNLNSHTILTILWMTERTGAKQTHQFSILFLLHKEKYSSAFHAKTPFSFKCKEKITKNDIFSNKPLCFGFLCSQQRRNAAKWYPDAEFLSQYSGVILYPTEETKWLKPFYNRKLFMPDGIS